MTSDFKVPYTTILDIYPHPNADRLEIATVYGFQVVVQKGIRKVGDKVIYIPVDSILPESLEAKLFPPDSKIKLDKHRVRQIRIRGIASQGMIVSLDEIYGSKESNHPETEDDLSKVLGILKYEPPIKVSSFTSSGKKIKRYENPNFHQYNGVNNIKWFPDFFKEDELVVVQEKLHGTNARIGIVPWTAKTWFHRLLKLLHLSPKWEKCYGSNLVQKQYNNKKHHFYGDDIWWDVFEKMDLFNRLENGLVLYGEIIGPGIQKGYSYGLKDHKFILFDVKIIKLDGSAKWLDPEEVRAIGLNLNIPCVPMLGPIKFNKEKIYGQTKGPSIFDPNEPVREGIVIKSFTNYDDCGSKRAVKWINEEYLDDKTNTDFH